MTGMSIVVLRADGLEIKMGLVFLIEPALKSSLDGKILPSFKRGGNIPTQINSQRLKPLFCEFLGSFSI